ncbi:MAG: GNAT family N-acetyltransferase [Chloroflexi bacterium]|nr:GNAT family N-acetyltransferase [Chloroflexota bacterium]
MATIFPYQDDDQPQVDAILAAGLSDQEAHAAGITPPETEGFVAEWRRRLDNALNNDPESCWVAEEDDEVVGFMWAPIVRRWPFPHMTVDQIDVHPDFRGRGIGRQLLDQAVCLARGRPIPLLIGGFMENPALRLYRRAGFVDLPDCIREDRNPNHFVLWWQDN